MARQGRPRWARHYPVLLITLLLLALLLQQQHSTGFSIGVSAAPTKDSVPDITRQSYGSTMYRKQLYPYHQLDAQTTDGVHRRGSGGSSTFRTPYEAAVLRRREIVQDVLEEPAEEGQELAKEISTNTKWQPNGSSSRAMSYQAKIAATICNSDTPQAMGPAWNGTFASNSPDGMYPSQTRSCTWTMQAINGTSLSVGGGNNKNPIPYVIAVNFTTPIQLVCGTDYLTLYDGADTTAPVLARICGNIFPNKLPTFYSTGPQLTAVFSSQAQSPGAFGFTATWTSVAPCSICVPALRGTCSSTNVCNCHNRFSGAVCEEDTAGYKDFTPRSQHAMAYDPNKDMVYIMGGTSLRNTFMWDLLTYTFATNKWNKITLTTKSPDPRYGHFAFIYNGDLYVYGGVSIVGGLADLWKFDGKVWTPKQPNNLEKLPVGRIGSTCVVVTNNNSTKLYVFGGLTAAGVTTRDLNVYDMNLALWKKSDHQNSVGLSGATAVYHQPTDSIYYFGGMVNQTTRNVITYQYRISQDLWYALAPRIDPLMTTPIPYWNGTEPDPSSSSNATITDTSSADDSSADIEQASTVQYLAPVMYDAVTSVWAPASLMGDDSVVIYGGMRPFGPGVNARDQSCYPSSFSIYDLSCQKWTSFDTGDLDTVIKSRANHTMIMRPPGAAGGSKTAWTAYIFGGFDGTDHADMLNFTMNVSLSTPSAINSCRALRWCSLYDDCQNCNANYCSYVNGLCLFDTDKTKNSPYLLGSSSDVPRNGTLQDLLRQRPDLKSQVMKIDGCPVRTALDLGNPYAGTIQSGQEITFKVYVDAHDLDIQYEIRTLPTSALDFKSLNVWEGFMNMYWRADHGLTDDSWNGISETSSPIPPDISIAPDNITVGDNAIITPLGVLNTSELMNRWTKYAGLDSSLTSSAKRDNSSYIYFPAVDPRRFSGYYVFSLTNRNPTALSFSVTVTLLNHFTPASKTPGTQFNMATLGFFMLGFILAVILLIFMARKIRQLIEDRDASHRAAEMQLLEDEDEERSRNGGGLNGGLTMVQMDGSMLLKKPMYRIVVGVQDLSKHISAISAISGGNNLRQRVVHGDGTTLKAGDISNTKKLMTRSHSESVVPQGLDREEQLGPQHRSSRVRSDFIRDIGSAPLQLPESDEVMAGIDNSMLHSSASLSDFRRMAVSTPDLGHEPESDLMEDVNGRLEETTTGNQSSSGKQERKIDANKEHAATQSSAQGGGLQRGWSLKSLSRATSFRVNQKPSGNNSEEHEALTSQHLIEDDEGFSRGSSGCYESEQDLVDLRVLPSHTDLLQIRQEQLERHQREMEEAHASGTGRTRNPVKVQPLSVEPLPFHAGLVPRTLPNLRQYQRYLARQQQRQQHQQPQQGREPSSTSVLNPVSASPGTGAVAGQRGNRLAVRMPSSNTLRSTISSRPSSRNHPTTSASSPQRLQLRQVRATRSQGSLREVRKVASRMTLRTNAEALFKGKEDEGHSRLRRSKSVVERCEWSANPSGLDNDDHAMGIELQQLMAPRANSSGDMTAQGQPLPTAAPAIEENSKRKPIKMRGRQEYEPGPLLAMNFLIVFPGDSGSRRVRQQGDLWHSEKATTMGDEPEESEEVKEGPKKKDKAENDDTLYNTEMRLPPMSIGTVFVPDPVRWWAYKAKQVLERKKFERQMRRMHRLKQQQQQQIDRPQPAKTR